MKTLQEMSFGHIAIESIMLFVVIIAALYLIYATAMSYIWLFKDTNKKTQNTKEASELCARARYEQTEKLMNEIQNDKNSIE